MTTVLAPAAKRHRPALVLAIIGILLFLGVSAAAGGASLILGIAAAPPTAWLDQIPLIGSWTVPGLVLGFGFGLGSLIAAYATWRRPRWRWLRPVERLTHHHAAWIGTILLGAGHLVWIGLEVVYLPELSFLQAVYGGVGLALVLLPLTPSACNHLRCPE